MTISDRIPGVSPEAASNDYDVSEMVAFQTWLEDALSNAIQQNLAKLEKDEAWALLHKMQARAMEQQAACIVLFSHGYFAPAEALCRTVIEAALNLHYSSLGDSCSQVLTYFRSYVETERRQNRNWKASVDASAYPPQAKEEHYQRIQGKNVALDNYERVLTETFSQIGRHYDQVPADWPSTFDRFKAIGKEVSYRTVYAALCSQTHNDAEDLLNDFVSGVTQIPGLRDAQAFENRNFSLYMMLMAQSYLVEATAIYLAKFDLDSNETLLQLLGEISSFIEGVTQRKFKLRPAT
jgi:Family of unknown function (DUF5677)